MLHIAMFGYTPMFLLHVVVFATDAIVIDMMHIDVLLRIAVLATHAILQNDESATYLL